MCGEVSIRLILKVVFHKSMMEGQRLLCYYICLDSLSQSANQVASHLCPLWDFLLECIWYNFTGILILIYQLWSLFLISYFWDSVTLVIDVFLYYICRWDSLTLAQIDAWISNDWHGGVLCAQFLCVVELLWSLVLLLYRVWNIFVFEGSCYLCMVMHYCY